MKFNAILLSVLTAASLGACGTQEANDSVTSVKTYTTPMTVLNGSSTAGSVSLSTMLELTNTKVKNEQDWLLISWISKSTGTAQLKFNRAGVPVKTSSLSVGEGPGSIILDPSGELRKLGEVIGTTKYTCGPQGQTCEKSIPTLEDSKETYPCGPQGKKCKNETPRPDFGIGSESEPAHTSVSR